MEQYKKLLQEILEKGTNKPAAREGMPGSRSLFGYQFRHNLVEGFPLLTTKEMKFKHIVVELLWFLKGDTNIKFLVDNGVNIWNEDAYNYYLKKFKELARPEDNETPLSFEDFVNVVKSDKIGYHDEKWFKRSKYKLGSCGSQYGALWRRWEITRESHFIEDKAEPFATAEYTFDQFADLIRGLKESPNGRRHIITAWNPATLEDMALNACHALAQFNCRPLSFQERLDLYINKSAQSTSCFNETMLQSMDEDGIPKYYLDCQMYQRSADMFLGVPYNIASYALLTHIVAKICNMVPGDFIHTFGDAHIYENHMEQVKEQLTRDCLPLPTLKITDEGNDWAYVSNSLDFSLFESGLKDMSDFQLEGYESHAPIKGKLSTGLK